MIVRGRQKRPSVSRLGQRRQVVIPKPICEEMGIVEGDFLEVTSRKGAVVIKPKRLVDADDVLTPVEEATVLKGMEQIRQGQYVTLKELEDALARKSLSGRKKAS
jgi:AbrB family looped-hinge helix DNA binding protein